MNNKITKFSIIYDFHINLEHNTHTNFENGVIFKCYKVFFFFRNQSGDHGYATAQTESGLMARDAGVLQPVEGAEVLSDPAERPVSPAEEAAPSVHGRPGHELPPSGTATDSNLEEEEPGSDGTLPPVSFVCW